MNNFVPISSLNGTLSSAAAEFLSDVLRRDAIETKEGTDKAGILRRMQNEQCQKCHEEYKKKHPGQQFAIKCFGIYDDPDYESAQQRLEDRGDEIAKDDIREVYDPAFWGSRHMVARNDDGDILPVAFRWYQEQALRCTSARKVDRWGRGMGKTFAGVTEELHFIANNKNTYTVVICPSKAQSQVWWDEINFQLEHSPSLAGMLVSSKQQPYFYFRFDNGGVLAIFTAGSKSGKGADAVRGQSPRRIRLDEQDFLADKDYQAIMPLLRRFSGSTFHGSSTPSGLRGMYWQMCNKMREYKEFYHPITQHPQWGTDQLNEESCLSEAKTMDRYLHEWLAEFGNPTAGVFKSHFVDLAMKPYRLSDCFYNPNCRYILGIDWNGKGTGTRICVVEYNPENKRRRLVAQAAVDDPKATTKKSFAALVRLNREWHCDHVYVDAGFGFVQDELIRDLGVEAGASDPDTARLKYINVIDFGAKLETNRIVPMRDPNSKYLPDPKEEELQRRTKPFIVEGTAMAFEMEYAEISRECALLEEQLRGYRVKTWSKGGAADTYETDAESGDHDLDAYMLAMLGVELNYGLWHTKETIQRLVKISHLSGWGMPADPTPATVPGKSNAQLGEIQAEIARETRSQKLQQAGIPARAEATGRSLVEKYRLLHLAKGAALLAPNTQSASPLAGNKVPSRTSIFGATGRPTGGHRFSRGF